MASETENCIGRVLDTIREYGLIAKPEKILAAVSGGADSVCLLHVLHEAGYAVEVAHFDHTTRDGASGEDAAFVRELAERLSLPFHCERRPIPAEAEASPLSFEEYAREARYTFLLRTAREAGCTVLATGHHAGDQAETVLMRILRGTTPHGLAGIPIIRDAGGIRIVRPLLECTRENILAFVEERGLAYRVDHTNADTRHFRNRVRHELLPLLCREYNPKTRGALLRLGEAQRCDNELLDALAESALRDCLVEDGVVDRGRFGALHRALQGRCLLKLAWRAGADPPYDRVNGAIKFMTAAPAGRRFDLGGGVVLANGRETSEVLLEPPAVDLSEIALAVPGETRAFGRTFRATYRDAAPAADLARYCHPARQVFDAAAVGSEPAVRHRRAGDRITPFGMAGSKKLQDYFVDIGLPASQRDAQLLVVAGDRIAWIVSHAISAHAAVTPATRRVLEIEVANET